MAPAEIDVESQDAGEDEAEDGHGDGQADGQGVGRRDGGFRNGRQVSVVGCGDGGVFRATDSGVVVVVVVIVACYRQ